MSLTSTCFVAGFFANERLISADTVLNEATRGAEAVDEVDVFLLVAFFAFFVDGTDGVSARHGFPDSCATKLSFSANSCPTS